MMILAASLLSAVLCSLGVLVIWRFREFGEKSMNYFMYFASGVLVSAAFMIAAPKAFSMNEYGPMFMLLGFLSIFLLDRFINLYVCHGHTKKCTRGFRISVVAAIGIALHSFVDGIIYSTTFTVSSFLGVMTTLGLIFHEFPEGIITFILFLKGGFSEKKSLIYSILIAALTTPLGAIISYPFISTLRGPKLGAMVGLTAGVLAFVGASHLLPEAERKSKKYGIIAFLLGIAVASVLVVVKGGV